MIARTALGTAADKTGAATLTISNVSLDDGDLLLVGIGYDTGQGAPALAWGNQDLELAEAVSGGGLACRVFSFHRRKGTKSKDLVATWSTGPTAKAMVAVKVTEVEAIELAFSQAETDTTDPDAGTAQATTTAAAFCFGIVATEGPLNDTAGTVQNGYTAGQRAGMNGAPPVSNITVHELFKILAATESTTAAKTGATSRDHCSVLTTWRAGRDNRMGVTPTDLSEMRRIFDNATPELKRRNHAFHWNGKLDQWELYDIDLSGGTLVATSDPDGDSEWDVI